MRFIAFAFWFILPFVSPGQKVDLSQSLIVSASFPKKFKFKISYSANISSDLRLFNQTAVIPFIDLKLSLFHNHIGTSVFKEFNSTLFPNLAFSYGAFLSTGERAGEKEDTRWERYQIQPVFTSGFANSFRNTYRYSLGLGTTYLWQQGGKNKYGQRTKAIMQKIGNVMLGTGHFYLTYYNDGGPFLSLFGDKEDRYWTGGLAIGYNLPDNHSIEVNYDKYTGFTENAFQVSGLFFNDNVVYKDLLETSFNTGKYGFRYLNRDLGLAGAINLWNTKRDFQDWLHLNISNNPYHPKLEKFYLDVEMTKIYNFSIKKIR